ncbi:4-vinyl reductase [Desulfosarcina sp. OttesenSCG-928-G10]|nr:4-vinyl reductase [Desulfosarcina sp. OttesenSCG-928-G10]MDL2320833.1 4-vinyl reductase [Desulfosarcina sp. OttesenSCG-928-B08]
MTTERKYKFNWDTSIGNLDIARTSLGPLTRVEVYRLFQFTLRDVLEQHYGADQSDALLREAGVLAGNAFFKQFCADVKDFSALVQRLQSLFKEMKIGILRLEKTDLENFEFMLTVDEDLDCSGMPDTSDVVCVYDEGLIQGILEAFTHKKFTVREVDCWCTGDRTCRFKAGIDAQG